MYSKLYTVESRSPDQYGSRPHPICWSRAGIGPTLFGRNGGGDPYFTDGEIGLATLVVDGARRTEPPETIPPPALIALKDQVWHGVSGLISPPSP